MARKEGQPLKGYEMDAIRVSVADIRPQVPALTPEARRMVLYHTANEVDTGYLPAFDSISDMEAWVDTLTLVQGLELAYRLLGRLLDEVSGWRRLLRWAIGKVMGLLMGAIQTALEQRDD